MFISLYIREAALDECLGWFPKDQGKTFNHRTWKDIISNLVRWRDTENLGYTSPRHPYIKHKLLDVIFTVKIIGKGQ